MSELIAAYYPELPYLSISYYSITPVSKLYERGRYGRDSDFEGLFIMNDSDVNRVLKIGPLFGRCPVTYRLDNGIYLSPEKEFSHFLPMSTSDSGALARPYSLNTANAIGSCRHLNGRGIWSVGLLI